MEEMCKHPKCSCGRGVMLDYMNDLKGQINENIRQLDIEDCDDIVMIVAYGNVLKMIKGYTDD
jgi:hypothetical protein